MENETVKLDGRISQNLKAAIRSAGNHRASPVHADTLQFWQDLLHHARAESRSLSPLARDEVERLMGELQGELAARER